MATPRVVWIDLCCVPQRHGLFLDAQSVLDGVHVTTLEAVPAAVHAHRPHFICVEYDYPDRTRLRIVPQMRCAFPELPLLMLTEFHSEALAIWAFRTRVWDYRVKPIDTATLANLVGALAHASQAAYRDGWLVHAIPPTLVAPAGHLRKPLVAAPRTAPAVAWISEHYAERCPIEIVAETCHLCVSEFSRDFHREQAVSFRHFLLHYRIAKARDFLAEPQASVSQVAYAVGFNDLSHFGRMFRRIVGVSASHYRRLGIATQPLGG